MRLDDISPEQGPTDTAATDTAATSAPLTRRQLRELEGTRAPRVAVPAASVPVSTSRRSTSSESTLTDSTPTNSSSTDPTSTPSTEVAAKPLATKAVSTKPVKVKNVKPMLVSNSVKRTKRSPFRTMLSGAAILGVGLILVSTSVPVNALFDPSEANAAISDVSTLAAETQEMAVTDSATAPVVSRDNYTYTEKPKPPPVVVTAMQTYGGNRNLTYTNTGSGAVRWPFPSGVPITSGFGARAAPCSYCSSMHQGLDFTPGSGYPIGVMADGVVSKVSVSNSGLGNHVIVSHVVNGQRVESVYAHMAYGSIQVATGQTVTVGQQLGAVGSTGASTGAHLHMEVHLDGVPIDPFAWLTANAS